MELAREKTHENECSSTPGILPFPMSEAVHSPNSAPLTQQQLNALNSTYGEIASVTLEKDGRGASRICIEFRQRLPGEFARRLRKKTQNFQETESILKGRRTAVLARERNIKLSPAEEAGVNFYRGIISPKFTVSLTEMVQFLAEILDIFNGKLNEAKQCLQKLREQELLKRPKSPMLFSALPALFDKALAAGEVYSVQRHGLHMVKKVCAPTTHDNLRRGVKWFCGEYGNSFVHLFSADEYIDALERDEPSPSKFNTRLTALKRMLDVAQSNGALPLAFEHELQDVRYKTSTFRIGPDSIYDPDESMKLLNGLETTQDVLFMAFRLFTGIRMAELWRLTWEMVDFAGGEIALPGEITKTGFARVIIIQPNFLEWIRPFSNHTGLVFDTTDVRINSLRVEIGRNVRRILGYLKYNASRHSFCSFRVAQCRQPGVAAEEAGHSIEIQKKHYRVAAKVGSAMRYFNIFPLEKDWVNSFSTRKQRGQPIAHITWVDFATITPEMRVLVPRGIESV